MSNNQIMKSGHFACFIPSSFGTAMLSTPLDDDGQGKPCVIAPITGTSLNTTLDGKPIAVEGDWQKVIVPNVGYNAPPYMQGTGTLKIIKLHPEHVFKEGTIGGEGKNILLLGTPATWFDAEFTVSSPATAPGNLKDLPPMKKYIGKGYFVSKGVG